MTAREMLNKKMRWFGRGLSIGFGLFLSSFIFVFWRFPPLILMAPLGIFVIIFAIAYIRTYALTCPRCLCNLGQRGALAGAWFVIDPLFKYCPYCALDMDTEIIDRSTNVQYTTNNPKAE
jgi:hypothetical protein